MHAVNPFYASFLLSVTTLCCFGCAKSNSYNTDYEMLKTVQLALWNTKESFTDVGDEDMLHVLVPYKVVLLATLFSLCFKLLSVQQMCLLTCEYCKNAISTSPAINNHCNKILSLLISPWSWNTQLFRSTESVRPFNADWVSQWTNVALVWRVIWFNSTWLVAVKRIILKWCSTHLCCFRFSSVLGWRRWLFHRTN